MIRALSRPWPAALSIGALAQALFSWRLTTPNKPMFDEVHYVPATRVLLSLARPANIEHPLLGKTIIAAGILLFGDDPLGWRVFSTVAATAVVMGVFAILQLTFRSVRTSTLGALLCLLNFTVFIQARIAMLDGFMAAFVVLAVAAMLWSARGERSAVTWRWLLGAVLLGLACGTKWTAVPYVGYAALAFVVVRRHSPDTWPGLGWFRAGWLLAVGASATYLLTFAPAFFYATEPLTLATLLPFQATMYGQQTQVLPPHTYQSSWWTWALDMRPIWYLYEPVDGVQRGVLMVGNPAVMWGGLVAVAACLGGWLGRRDVKLGAAAALWIGSYLVWAIIPKSLGFFYYYYLPSIWLPVVIAAAFHRFDDGRLRGWDETFLLLSAILFAWFYPILSASALSGPQAFLRWMWFKSWL
jgi:dolichyl-phosphate-mannose--protein O-mannosyl transferase